MRRLPFAALLIAFALSGAAAPVTVDVRMMSAQEVSGRYDVDQARLSMAAGVFVAPAALLMASTAEGQASGLLGPPSSMEFQSLLPPVRQALVGTDMAALLRTALEARIAALPEGEVSAQMLSVALAWYGVQSADGRPTMMDADDQFCVVVAGAATVVRDGDALPEQQFTRGVNALSPGMSDPACASFAEYGENGAQPLRQGLSAAAEAVADWLMENALAR